MSELQMGQRPLPLTSSPQSWHKHLCPHGMQACVLVAAKQMPQLFICRGVISSFKLAETNGILSCSLLKRCLSICPINARTSSSSSEPYWEEWRYYLGQLEQPEQPQQQKQPQLQEQPQLQDRQLQQREQPQLQYRQLQFQIPGLVIFICWFKIL
ncbi:uncharacterized protein LOC126844077 [Adelges cooleyi]|uniref:uncharacterized protein LOC126844077 n=1 Tax=Adelges cooleyi TaxID=133065 RepID=UPI00217FB328|nr:uncharacterized protein LOC126844077 [Adelges cooleyi]